MFTPDSRNWHLKNFDSVKIEPGEAGVIGYFSRYLARKVRNLVTCTSCNQFLLSSHTPDYCQTEKPLVKVDEAENLPEAFRIRIDLHDRGGLGYTFYHDSSDIFREITTDDKRRPKFLVAYCPEEVFVKIYIEVMSNEFSASHWECQSGCNLINTVLYLQSPGPCSMC